MSKLASGKAIDRSLFLFLIWQEQERAVREREPSRQRTESRGANRKNCERREGRRYSGTS